MFSNIDAPFLFTFGCCLKHWVICWKDKKILLVENTLAYFEKDKMFSNIDAPFLFTFWHYLKHWMKGQKDWEILRVENTLAYFDKDKMFSNIDAPFLFIFWHYLKHGMKGPKRLRNLLSGKHSSLFWQKKISSIDNWGCILVMCYPSMNKLWATQTHRDLCIGLSRPLTVSS